MLGALPRANLALLWLCVPVAHPAAFGQARVPLPVAHAHGFASVKRGPLPWAPGVAGALGHSSRCRAAICPVMRAADAAPRWNAARPARLRAQSPPNAAAADEDESRAASTRVIVLALLVLQNSLTAILARASRVPAPGSSQLYLGSVAVFAAEAIKLPICLALIARDVGGPKETLKQVYTQVVVKWRDTLQMAVPALCYCLQNALFYVALSRLTATSYQLWSQSKTLFTALFFVSYLGQALRKQQWLALFLLSAGVGLVQYQEAAAASTAAAAATAAGGSMFVAVGVLAVLASSILSGFANVRPHAWATPAGNACEGCVHA